MKNSKFQTLLFSTAGVALVFIAIVGAIPATATPMAPTRPTERIR